MDVCAGVAREIFAMPDDPSRAFKIPPQQMAALLDTAMGLPHPLTYLDNVASVFGNLGRHADARAVATVGCLVAENEIEILMSLRAAWRRGEVRDPVKANAGYAGREWTDWTTGL